MFFVTIKYNIKKNSVINKQAKLLKRSEYDPNRFDFFHKISFLSTKKFNTHNVSGLMKSFLKIANCLISEYHHLIFGKI